MLTIFETAVRQSGANIPCAGVCRAGQNYWSRNQQGHSEWQGRLAEQWACTVLSAPNILRDSAKASIRTPKSNLSGIRLSRTYEGKFGRE